MKYEKLAWIRNIAADFAVVFLFLIGTGTTVHAEVTDSGTCGEPNQRL